MEIYKVRTKYGASELVEINRPEFVEGIAYKIAPDSEYAELKYKGKTRPIFDESQSFIDFYTFVADIKHTLADEARVRTFLTGMASTSYTVVASDLVDYDSRDQAAKPGKTSQRAKVEKFFSFEASLSMRIEKGKLISWQVDDVRLTETDDVPDTLKHLP